MTTGLRFYANVIIVFLLLLYQYSGYSQKSLDYYLPDITYDAHTTTPEAFLSYQIGEWHISHDQLYYYLKSLCESSDKCILEEYARSHENRPLINLVISSSSNITNIDALRTTHNSLTDAGQSAHMDINEMPLVIYQGYSIHGNESSGANAATLMAYYLLAGKSDHLDALLNECIIIIDPCYNPDGLQRFSTWANSHKHVTDNTDPQDREFNEMWPGGRTNHYWFDLNRDWLFNIHPSSKGRIKVFHKWKPDVLTDHHEMGSNSTFFFQPGVPSRTNPNTPQINQDLTEEISAYHANFLDSIGSAYFTKERFDDYYYGKGSTYPDINGCIGILFEQASSRGHLKETSNGLLSFPFTIRNQVVTSLSTQKAALDLKTKILSYKRDFYQQSVQGQKLNGYYVFETEDPFKAGFFKSLLKRHDIMLFKPSSDLVLNGEVFKASQSYLVPKRQKQSGLVKTIFETVTEFRDSLFYDVSAWTLPLALNLKYGESLKDYNEELLSIKEGDLAIRPPLDENGIGAVIPWSYYMSPTLLYQLLDNGLKVKSLKKNAVYQTNTGKQSFKAGDLLVEWTDQNIEKSKLIHLIDSLSTEMSIPSYTLNSFLAEEGISAGSSHAQVVSKPKLAMIVGQGINAYEAGDIWYQIDKRLGMPVSKLDIKDINATQLDKYNVIIMPDGKYSSVGMLDNKIKQWTLEGGTLLCFRRAVEFARVQKWIKDLQVVEDSLPDKSLVSRYINYVNTKESQLIGGAIFNTDIDTNHPLLFGYDQNTLPMFKKGTQFYTSSKSSASPMTYTANPVLSGYASSENKTKAAGASAVFCSQYGQGKIISCVDNPNFRAYWLGASKLFANMIFLNELIDEDTLGR